MKRMPFTLHGKGGFASLIAAQNSAAQTVAFAAAAAAAAKQKQRESSEPRSVLDQRRSSSPPISTSTSTFSAEVAAVSDDPSQQQPWKEEWGELQPLPLDTSMDDDWDSLLQPQQQQPPHDPSSLLRWLVEPDPQQPPFPDLDSSAPTALDSSLLFEGFLCGASDSAKMVAFSGGFPLSTTASTTTQPNPTSLPAVTTSGGSLPFHHHHSSTMFYREPNLPTCTFPTQRHQNPPVFIPATPLDHHQLLLPNQSHGLVGSPAVQLQRQGKPKEGPPEQQGAVDQLLRAAEQIEAGNPLSAHTILARLNHLSPHHGKPLLRSSYYFREALSAALDPSTPCSRSITSPWDVVLKLTAYKAFSEVSPVPQFVNFTCVQALLEELVGYDHIHLIDFDIGVGGQWSSFMQELAQRRCSNAASGMPSLKITAFVSPASHHPLELVLVQDNLSHFAGELGIPFEFTVLAVDAFELAAASFVPMGNEVIAVNLPAGLPCASSSALLRLLKQLAPKIVVSVDHGCDRRELSFSQHFLHSLYSCTMLLDSMDAANASSDVVGKIGRFLLQPRIDNLVLGMCHGREKVLPWRMLFSSAGFTPIQFSNFTETQAECLLKRTQVRGFQVEKRQLSSLALFWQREELVSVSAWKC